MSIISQITNPSDGGGSLAYVQSALDIKRAGWNQIHIASGGVSDYRIDTPNGFPLAGGVPKGDFCRSAGGVRKLGERFVGTKVFASPTAGRAPSLLQNVAQINGHAALQFRDSGAQDQSLSPFNPALMAHGVSGDQSVTFSMLMKVENTLVSNWVISPLIHASATNDFALVISNSGALQYLRIFNANTSAVRWQEQVATDLNSLWHHWLVGYNTTNGFRVALDGVLLTRAAVTPVDVTGFTNGQYQIGTRGTALVGADFDLAMLTVFNGIDLFKPANAAMLADEINTVSSEFAY